MLQHRPSAGKLAEQCSYIQPLAISGAKVYGERRTRSRRRGAGALAAAFEQMERRILFSVVPITTAQGVDGGPSTDDSGPMVASSTSSYVVLWMDYSSLDFRIYSPSGSALTNALPVEAAGNDVSTWQDPKPYDVAMNSAGNFVVAWGGGTSHIYAQEFNSDGTTNGSMITVSSSASGSTPATPTVAMDDAGDFVVAWVEQESVTVNQLTITPKTTHQVYDFETHKVKTRTYSKSTGYSAYTDETGVVEMRRFDASGNGGAVVTLNIAPASATGSEISATYSSGLNSTVAMDAAGDFVVGWDQLTYAPVKQVGSPASSETTRHRWYDGSNHKHTYLLKDTSGISYFYGMSSTNVAAEFQKFSADATATNTPTAVSKVVAAISTKSSISLKATPDNLGISMDSSGDFAIVNSIDYHRDTKKESTSNGTKQEENIYQVSGEINFKRYSAAGNAGPLVNVANTPLSKATTVTGQSLLVDMSTAMDSAGDVAVAWSQYVYLQKYDVTQETGVVARRYDSTSKALDPSPVVLVPKPYVFGGSASGVNEAVLAFSGSVLNIAYDLVDDEVTPQSGPIFTQQFEGSSATRLKIVSQSRSLAPEEDGTVTVQILDASGRAVADGSVVTLAVSNDVASLAWTATANDSGLATFSDVAFRLPWLYVLTASDGSLKMVNSAAITVEQEPSA